MGSYVNDNLIQGEKVTYEATPHWIIFVSLRGLLTLFIAPLIDMYTNEYAITNRRIIVKVGLFSRRTLEMNLPKIESIKVDQSIPGRIFGYGDIVIVGSGGSSEAFENIRAPLEFRRQYQQALHNASESANPSSSQAPGQDVTAFCAKCGARLGENASFCMSCGEKIIHSR